MSRETRPPGLGTRAAKGQFCCGNESENPRANQPTTQALRRATAASAAACLGWPHRIAVSDAAIKKAGGSTAIAREVQFVRAGLAAAGPAAAQRALQVRLKFGDRIVDALPLEPWGAP